MRFVWEMEAPLNSLLSQRLARSSLGLVPSCSPTLKLVVTELRMMPCEPCPLELLSKSGIYMHWNVSARSIWMEIAREIAEFKNQKGTDWYIIVSKLLSRRQCAIPEKLEAESRLRWKLQSSTDFSTARCLPTVVPRVTWHANVRFARFRLSACQ